MGAYQSAMKRLGHTRAFRAVLKRTLPTIDRTVNRLSGGKFTLGSTVAPTFILVHTGRKSGREYRTPVAYVRLENGYALAGSNWGQAKHPAWSGNLIANPDARVIVGGEEVSVHARLALGVERAAIWERFVAMWPAYNTYDRRSGDRNIRVFVLERQ
jgi:deazaflavin-dependent oxidoreductase (nitroreductase family)